MKWEADDIEHLRRHIARINEVAAKMRAAEAAGDETNAVGAGLALDCEMEWLAPECVNFTEAILDAFGAMEREKADLYYSHRYDAWMLSGEKLDGKATSPLAALLAAAEDKSDG